MIRVVQCWDDGVEDDLRLIELLRRHRATATFNLNPGLHDASRGHGWSFRGVKQVLRLARSELVSAYAGFTIANHTVSHPRPLEIPLDTWRREVEDGRKQLQDLFGQPVLGFAYPFGTNDEATADVVRAAGHVYGRTTGKATPCLPAADLARWAPDCHFLAPEFWERFAAAKASPAGVFYFWGHSYELVTDGDWAAFDAKLARLAADPDVVWSELPDVAASA